MGPDNSVWSVRQRRAVAQRDAQYSVVDENGLEVAFCGSRKEDAAQIAADHDNVGAMLAALEAALPALVVLGDYIGNAHDGRTASGVAPFDRCAIVLAVRDAIAAAGGAL